MTVVEVEVVHAQALQRGMAGVVHVLARQTFLRQQRIVDGAEVRLAGDHEAVPWQAQVGDHVAHHPFCRSDEHTSELQSLMRLSYAVLCWKKKRKRQTNRSQRQRTLQSSECETQSN